MPGTRGLLIVLLSCSVLLVVSCRHLPFPPPVVPVPEVRVRGNPGPPPHAPAHGYRHKHHHGHELVFDAGLGVYTLIGFPGVYFHDGHYFRYRDHAWQFTLSLDSPWRLDRDGRVPVKLKQGKEQKKQKQKKRKKKSW